MKKELNIVFFGTPEFAVASLDALYNENLKIAAVITAPDKPAGRGKRLSQSAVKDYALEKGFRVLQPTNLKDVSFLNELKELKANLQVVVAFRMLPEVVWNMPELGTINLHASLLPQYRGAAPINHAIINGEKETGVTTFFLQHQIDTGNIIFQEKITIANEEDAGSLHDRMMVLGAELVVKTIRAIEQGDCPVVPQHQLNVVGKQLQPAPKLTKEFCKINWTDGADRIFNFVRGLSPHPGAYSTLTSGDDQAFHVKIYRVEKRHMGHNNPTGTVETNNKDKFSVWTSDGLIDILDIQFPGKKRMNVKEMLNGMRFPGLWKMC